MQGHAIATIADGLIRAKGEPNGEMVASRQLEYAADMVLMFMRDNDAGKLADGHLQSRQTLLGFAYPETAIQHDRGARRAGLGRDQ